MYLDLAARVIGAIVAVNGFYLSTEIKAIAGSKGLWPWMPAARLRQQHYDPLSRLALFPSEIIRVFMHLTTATTTPATAATDKKKDDDDNNKNNIHGDQEALSPPSPDEVLLTRWCVALGISGCCIAVFGFPAPISFFCAWLLYVCIAEPAALFFPWHCLLAETLLLMTVCQAPLLLQRQYYSFDNATNDDESAAFHLPVLRVAAAACEARSQLSLSLLLCRLMLGFAKSKFANSDREDVMYLLPFLRSMPMPHWAGLKAAQLLERFLWSDDTHKQRCR